MQAQFWQALGKALKWNSIKTQVEGSDSFSLIKSGKRWKHIALRFHEINLTEGWDKAVEYLNNLIK